MRLIFLSLFILSNFIVNAQNRIKEFEHYNIKDKKDNIDFIVLKDQNTTKKPVLLFCEGSQPVPLFLKMYGDTIAITLSNFDINHMSEFYHVVVISRPYTPIIADTSEINDYYNYVTDKYNNPYSYSIDFLKHDTKEITTRRANKVWKFLKNQKWVDNSSFVVYGHSQGAREAVEIAYSNKEVTKIGLSGYDPYGRFEQMIRTNRKNAESGKITWEEADSLDLQQLEFFKSTLVDYKQLEHPGSYSWKSFNEPGLDKLLKLKVPIYIAYGSNDITSVNCDLLPFYFAKKDKTNLTIKRYGGLEHNFFPIKEDGMPDYKEPHWIEVMNEFIDWSKNQSNR